MQLCIVDLYTDEPAGLGVPPYLGTMQRYVFGAAKSSGHQPVYLTIDDVRESQGKDCQNINLTPNSDDALSHIRQSPIVIILGGVHTPGKYLRAEPGTPKEIREIISLAQGRVLVGGPLAHGTMGGGRAFPSTGIALGNSAQLIDGDPEAFISDLFESNTPPNCPKYRSYSELKKLAIWGTGIIKQINLGPDTIAEIETSRGCSRALVGGCSFCSECSRYGLPEFRPVDDIYAEVKALRKEGVRNFRLGRQSCFFSYGASGIGESEIPVPDPSSIRKILSACSSLSLNSLHIDNVNPAVVAAYPEESAEIVDIIVEHCTPGNVAALGIESADPAVISKNNLKSSPKESLDAIRLICKQGNQIGSNGQPCFLPGINFVLGLPGETKRTYELNMNFLKSILDEDLPVRRINIRDVIPVPGTPLFDQKWNRKAYRESGRSFKKEVRESIDRPMLRRVFPTGRIIRGVVSESREGSVSFCRFPGSYPIILGVYGEIELRQVLDAIVVSHGFRSLTALKFPLDINRCQMKAITQIRGIGKKRAAKIFRSRPIASFQDLEEALQPDPPYSALELLARAALLE